MLHRHLQAVYGKRFDAFGLASTLVNEAYWVNETTFWSPDSTDRSGIARTGRVQDVADRDGTAAFGRITSTAGEPRNAQIGLKFIF